MIKNIEVLPDCIKPYIIKSFKYNNVDCFIAHHKTGSGKYKTDWFCGYAKVTNVDLHSYKFTEDVDVHGGVTFNQDGVIGFDCNHWNDNTGYYDTEYGHVWNEDEVIQETKDMVDSFNNLMINRSNDYLHEKKPRYFS